MLGVLIQKIWHKKWMVLCLLLGCILLIATVISFPLYRNAAFDRMLVDMFNNELETTGQWPAKNIMTMVSKKDKTGNSIRIMEEVFPTLNSTLGVDGKESIKYYALSKGNVESEMKRQDLKDVALRIGFMSNLPDHAKMLSGEMYSEDGWNEEKDAFEVVISQSCMVTNNLLVGETLVFKDLKTHDGGQIKIKIVGVFEEADRNDFYWQVKPDAMNIVCLMNENLFYEYFTGDKAGRYTITCNYYQLFEYDTLTFEGIGKLLDQTEWLTSQSKIKSTVKDPVYIDVLKEYQKKRERIDATLFILQVPVLILLAAFLFMISGQMYDMERNEISVMKSRGGSSGQMFRLYLYQSTFLALIGAVGGIPLGAAFCKVLGSTQNFLEFNTRRQLPIHFGQQVVMYCLYAILACILIMTIPALKHSRLTIVKLKQSNALKKKSFWEKIFLDVICIAVSLYGYYTFHKGQRELALNVLQGEPLDPLLYISSSLFIVGMGLLFLRLQPLLVKAVYLLGKNFWQPASYASFMENLKNGRKQQFIMLFMILTISLGMYHTIVARTILQNAKDNEEYIDAVDIIIKEKWADNSSDASNGAFEFRYIEPDYNRFASIPGARSFTKVIYDDASSVNLPDKAVSQCILMGIHTKEFGQMTQLDSSLLDRPYYQCLNELAAVPKGLLVSRNMETTYGYKIGDTLDFQNGRELKTSGEIVGFLDYWPGFAPVSMTLKADGTAESNDNILIVANIAQLQKTFGTTPYEVWVDMEDGADYSQVYRWIEENSLRVLKFSDKEAKLKNVIEDPLLQGTNGVLTMGFIVTIILCGVGYLIYWVMSIRSREMMFGILRACGMHKGEILKMLFNEQIFSGVLSILAGVGIGTLTSKMYVPMLQIAYSAANQVLPMKLIIYTSDMVRLYGVIAAVMVICLVVLIVLVFKMNVTKALKLGEE